MGGLCTRCCTPQGNSRTFSRNLLMASNSPRGDRQRCRYWDCGKGCKGIDRQGKCQSWHDPERLSLNLCHMDYGNRDHKLEECCRIHRCGRTGRQIFYGQAAAALTAARDGGQVVAERPPPTFAVNQCMREHDPFYEAFLLDYNNLQTRAERLTLLHRITDPFWMDGRFHHVVNDTPMLKDYFARLRQHILEHHQDQRRQEPFQPEPAEPPADRRSMQVDVHSEPPSSSSSAGFIEA